MQVGDRIKELRQERPNYSQLKLAKETGLTPAAISQYESNLRKPNADALKKIANVFNVSVDYLLGDDSLNTDELSQESIQLCRRIEGLDNKGKKIIKRLLDEFESED